MITTAITIIAACVPVNLEDPDKRKSFSDNLNAATTLHTKDLKKQTNVLFDTDCFMFKVSYLCPKILSQRPHRIQLNSSI